MIYIDWALKIIHIQKNDMLLVQSVPTEIRQLDIDSFRLILKGIEDGSDGMSYPATHNHNTSVTLSGVVYARVIEIINGFTITFEDGQYAVNLVGANSNIADVVNVNQVSVRASNSAGLIVTNTAGTNPIDVANAVWNHSTGTLIAIRLAEVWGRLGLDPTKPLITGNTTITFGDIVMTLAELNNTVTVARQ